MINWILAVFFCATLLSVSEHGLSATNTLGRSNFPRSPETRQSSSYHPDKRNNVNKKYVPLDEGSYSGNSQSCSGVQCSLPTNMTFYESEKSSSSESMVLIRIPKKYLLSIPFCQCKTGSHRRSDSHKKHSHRDRHKIHGTSTIETNAIDRYNKNIHDTKLKYKHKKSLNKHGKHHHECITVETFVDFSRTVKTPQFQKAVNEIFDKTLEKYRNTANVTGKISIKFEDIEHNFTMKVPLFRYEIHGKMHACDGKLKDLSTLYRSGDVHAETDNKYLNFTVPLVLKNMIIDFDHCEVRCMGFVRRGTAKGHVGHNLITVKLAMPLLHACSVHLNKVEMTDLNKLSVDMNGFGFIDKFHRRAADSIMIDHTTKYKPSIEKRLTSVLRTVFENTNLCNYVDELKKFGVVS